MRMKIIVSSAAIAIGVLAALPGMALATSEASLESCEATGGAADPLAGLALAAKPGPTPDATCTATCSGGSTVTCTGTACSAVDSACPSQRGYVTCGSTTIWCPACAPPPQCKRCTSDEECGTTYCGGPDLGVCINRCCLCK